MKLLIKNYSEEDFETYIGPLTKKNMKALFEKNFGGWSDCVSKNKITNVSKTGFIKLFFQENKFLGYVSFEQEKNNKNSFIINDIHIKKEYQKQGFGTKILNYVITKAKENQIKQIKIFVFKNNPSINFYKKHNFKEIEFLEKSNTSIMIKRLDL